MPRVLLLVAVVIALLILVRRVQSLPPHKRRGGYIQLGLGTAVVVVVMLTLAGKMHWVGAALTGLVVVARQALPLVVRAFPFLAQWFKQRQGPSGGSAQYSEVKSQLLRMTLDHATGELDGEVIGGSYKDWLLSEMDQSQLQDLLGQCRGSDPDSEQLLQSYLEQRFPDGFEAGEAQGQGSDEGTQAASGMTRSEALAVLGLDANASDEEIAAAHRSLIQKLHPDRGGNDYLASKINQAKDFLLKG